MVRIAFHALHLLRQSVYLILVSMRQMHALVAGIGIAYFGVSPFIMTLGVQSVGLGIALFGLLLGRAALGNYFHAVGGNAKAAALSGIDVQRVLMFA